MVNKLQRIIQKVIKSSNIQFLIDNYSSIGLFRSLEKQNKYLCDLIRSIFSILWTMKRRKLKGNRIFGSKMIQTKTQIIKYGLKTFIYLYFDGVDKLI